MQLVVELNRATDRVMAHDESTRIVHQHDLRHAAEGREGALEAGEPAFLLFVPERPNVHAAANARASQRT